MQKLEVKRGEIIGWYCNNYNLFNDILTINCNYCNEIRNESLSSAAISTTLQRSGVVTELKIMSETNKEDYYALYFNRWNTEADAEITAKSDTELSDWIQQMSLIALEAKVKTSRGNAALRERKAKALAANKPWLVPADSHEFPQLDKQKATPKPRQSKMEKLLAGMKNLGVEIPEGFIEQVRAKEKTTATENIKLVTKSDTSGFCLETSNRHTECTGSFIRSNEKYTCNCECHKAPLRKDSNIPIVEDVIELPKNDEPFDFSKLGD